MLKTKFIIAGIGILALITFSTAFFISGQQQEIRTRAQNDQAVPPILPTASTPCHLLTSSSPIPDRFAAAYNVFTTAHELLIKTNCTANGTVLAEVGSGGASQYIYKDVYEKRNGRWVKVELNGTKRNGSWFIGTAKATLSRIQTDLENTNEILAYTCEKINGAFKCGCRDKDTCTEKGSWQKQEFRHTRTGLNQDTDDNLENNDTGCPGITTFGNCLRSGEKYIIDYGMDQGRRTQAENDCRTNRGTFDECGSSGNLGVCSLKCEIPVRTNSQDNQARCVVWADCNGFRRTCISEDDPQRDIMTICRLDPDRVEDPRNQCLRNAICERQTNGQCGWRQTPQLNQCLQAAAADN